MNRGLWLISIVSYAVAVSATEWQPSAEFLKAVRSIESSNGQFKVGDNGQSLGDFQLSEAAWLDVNEWRRLRSLKIYRYDEAVFNGYINRAYASNYLTILHGELSRNSDASRRMRNFTQPIIWAWRSSRSAIIG